MNCDKVKAPSPAATTEVLLGNAALAVLEGLEELPVTSVVAPAGGGGAADEGEKAVAANGVAEASFDGAELPTELIASTVK